MGNKNKDFMKALSAVSYLTQVGLSIATPIVLALLLANFLVNKNIAGPWVYAVLIILGLGAGIMSFYSFIQYVMRKNKKIDKSAERTVPDELRGKLD